MFENVIIYLGCLNVFLGEVDATFIKMDIEGAEKNAILGAAHIIKKNKPKLVICIYHSDGDMMNIQLVIHEMVPEYKLYVRHHSNSYPETVLYVTT
ncbi:FkbM family methyltransferase [Butyrivibrio sp. INlla18]|uniref:FkbM family methyltransferase n=1 Tax=Butyrivibrio sp. INlla18 TaxID=1520806 RepID=UPI003FA49769